MLADLADADPEGVEDGVRLPSGRLNRLGKTPIDRIHFAANNQQEHFRPTSATQVCQIAWSAPDFGKEKGTEEPLHNSARNPAV